MCVFALKWHKTWEILQFFHSIRRRCRYFSYICTVLNQQITIDVDYTSGDTEMSTITFSVEGPDNIETIRTESVEAPAYDIYGRRVDAANARGVFIQKGEKMIK